MSGLLDRTRPIGDRCLATTLLAAALLGAAPAAAEADGEALYLQHCVACHQADGSGVAGVYPALDGNDFVLGDPHEPARVVLFGRGAMPPFHQQLSDEQIAAVLTHVRKSWTNDAERVEAQQVAEVREAEAADPEDLEPIEVDLPDDWLERGQELFAANCAACHQVDGVGVPGAFPALAGNAFVVGAAEHVIEVVLSGRAGMPSFSGLQNEQIALVLSYVRTAWGNDAHPVDAGMVERVRGGEALDIPPGTPFTRPGAAN